MPSSAPRSLGGISLSSLALRVTGAALTIAAYLLLRDQLSAAAEVVARFAVGVALFVLLVDVGRAIVGAKPVLAQGFSPHAQQAEALVDEDYRRVHKAVRSFVDEGRWTPEYEEVLEQVLEARSVPDAERQALLDQARETTGPPVAAHRPLSLALSSGLVVIVGLALALVPLLELLPGDAVGPLVLLVGAGVYLLQSRTIHAGARWATLTVGATGAAMVFASARWLLGGWGLLEGLAGLLALTTLGIVALHGFQRDPWPIARKRLREDLSTLRRAFLGTLLAGLVLFPLQPVLEALFEALGWPSAGLYRLLVVGYATLAAFLVLELVGAWYALDRGSRSEARRRAQRLSVQQDLFDHLDRSSGKKAAGGTP